MYNRKPCNVIMYVSDHIMSSLSVIPGSTQVSRLLNSPLNTMKTTENGKTMLHGYAWMLEYIIIFCGANCHLPLRLLLHAVHRMLWILKRRKLFRKVSRWAELLIGPPTNHCSDFHSSELWCNSRNYLLTNKVISWLWWAPWMSFVNRTLEFSNFNC